MPCPHTAHLSHRIDLDDMPSVKHIICLLNVDQHVGEATSLVWDAWDTRFIWDMQVNLSSRQLEIRACSSGRRWELEIEVQATSA